MKVYLVGGGRAGRALARLCAELGHDVLGVFHRGAGDAASTSVPGHAGALAPIPPEAEWVWLLVPDRAISGVAAALWTAGALTATQVVAHASGALPASLIREAAPGVRAVVGLHPLQSLTGADSDVDALRRAAFFVEGETAGVEMARELLRPAGIVPFAIGAEAKPLYHAAAVLTSNATVALLDAASELLTKAGVPRDEALAALLPLLRGTVENLCRVGLPGALTGPASRGDAATIAGHIAALELEAPHIAPIYVSLTARALRIAEDQGVAPPDALAEVARTLGLPWPPPRG